MKAPGHMAEVMLYILFSTPSPLRKIFGNYVDRQLPRKHFFSFYCGGKQKSVFVEAFVELF